MERHRWRGQVRDRAGAPVIPPYAQLLAHLVGDYVLQNHWMAALKSSDKRVAAVHALFYGLPFLLLVSSPAQWLVIVMTHAAIDHYRLAAAWVRLWGIGTMGA